MADEGSGRVSKKSSAIIESYVNIACLEDITGGTEAWVILKKSRCKCKNSYMQIYDICTYMYTYILYTRIYALHIL